MKEAASKRKSFRDHFSLRIIFTFLTMADIISSLLFFLPLHFDILGVWLAIPISEFLVAIIALCYIHKRT